jgi:hypothetical protein
MFLPSFYNYSDSGIDAAIKAWQKHLIIVFQKQTIVHVMFLLLPFSAP